MNQLTELCQACKTNPTSIKDHSDDENQPYRLCHSCHERLIKYSLKPIEWYNLAVIHSPNKFLLHDDFYEENGEATQPEEEVDVSVDDMAPLLEDVQHDLEQLVNFTITRWYIEDELRQALSKHDNVSLLNSVKTRFYQTTNVEVKARMLEIVAEVLDDIASEWVKVLWQDYNKNLLVQLSWATASCIPTKEGLKYVFEQLQSFNEKERQMSVFSCLHRFRSTEVLDWIEANCNAFHDNWGRLAALCFPTWERMRNWLEIGRPLSLVALDTMDKCAAIGNDPYVEKYSPKILNTNVNEIELVIDNYYEIDKVSRVKKKRERILHRKDIIFE
ncbi:hypothetical protein [Metabacillus malikii]|uniref:Uncharacterized protein n=1 Tax=Metabacillus malikii TaxID=1504265 RepID=A0ABT9ZD40_9BACI|nr:hypothetical protein [Metabacillus malikii]MDQ0230185.1 hypothetical protein [Metabacillus malikii]